MKFLLIIIFLLNISLTYASEKELWPKNCDSAVKQLLLDLSPESRIFLQKQPWDDLILLHRGLGMKIRNDFGLWQGNKHLISSCLGTGSHPESVSQIIIEKTWLRLNLQKYCNSQKQSNCTWYLKHNAYLLKKKNKQQHDLKKLLKKLKYLGFFNGSVEEKTPRGVLKAYMEYKQFINQK